ncbi:MAG: hypothetical protein IJY90_00645 [Clostridia bacterium]|nr:hypothetical protein [Clostridia bacterium]
MEKVKMSATKKLTVAVISMAVALCFVVGGLIGVWAAAQQSVGSNFEVKYEVGALVAANVTAKYQKVGGDPVAMGEGITFNANDVQGATSYDKLSASEVIALDKDTQSVTFTYTFKNLGETAYTVTLADNATRDNVTVVYSSVDAEGNFKPVNVPALAGDEGSDVDAVEITITVSITDANKSASYKSAEGNAIVWTLSAVGA